MVYLRGRRQPQLREDARDVLLDRGGERRAAGRSRGSCRPSAISSSASRSRARQALEWVVARMRPTSSATTSGSSAEPLADASYRGGELVDVGDPVLEEVAEPCAPSPSSSTA